MFKGMKKDGIWYKIKNIDKIKKSEYVKFQFTSDKFEEAMKLLEPKPKKSTTTKKVSNS